MSLIDRKSLAQQVVEHQGEDPLAMLDQVLAHMNEQQVRLYRAERMIDWGEADAVQVAEVVIRRLREARVKPHLFFLDRGDQGFLPDQVQALLDGENMYESAAFQNLVDNMDEYLHERSKEAVREACESDEERDLLDADLDAFDEVRDVVVELDTSDWYRDYLRVTDNMLFRYALDHEVTPWEGGDSREDELTRLAEALGVDVAPYRDALTSIIDECAHYGGQLEVMWYGDAEDALRLAAPDARYDDEGNPLPNDPTLGHVTFHSPRILVRDGLNGAGMDAKIDGDLRLPWLPGRVRADAAGGGGYSWTEIAGPVESAYAADFTLVRVGE